MKDFNFFYMLGIIVIFSSILFLTYVTTKYLAGKAGKITKGKHLNIIENVALGKDRYLHLIKVENEFMLIASSGKGIEFLSWVNIDNYVQSTDNIQTPFSFKNILEKKVSDYIQKSSIMHRKYKCKNGNTGEKSDIRLTKFENNLDKIRAITREAETDKEE
ncbi:MAG TPA: flagellar biosynthetic protein FliO [Clostridiaceae bacterium]|jgi:flagellar protein FliO/FliZ|nr:flagellar biosynthetic protein FliO [Clostridiaceae bacterium]